MLLDDSRHTLLFHLLCGKLLHFHIALLLVNCQLFLPESLDLSFVLLLPHAAALGVHLFETLVLREFFHELALEFVLHALFLGSSLRLKS